MTKVLVNAVDRRFAYLEYLKLVTSFSSHVISVLLISYTTLVITVSTTFANKEDYLRLKQVIQNRDILTFGVELEKVSDLTQEEFQSLVHDAGNPSLAPEFLSTVLAASDRLVNPSFHQCLTTFISPRSLVISLAGVKHVLDSHKERGEVQPDIEYLVTDDPRESAKKVYNDSTSKNVAIIFNNEKNRAIKSLHTSILYINKEKNECTFIDSVDSSMGEGASWWFSAQVRWMQTDILKNCKVIIIPTKRQMDSFSCPVFAIHDFLSLTTLSLPKDLPHLTDQSECIDQSHLVLEPAFFKLSQNFETIKSYLEKYPEHKSQLESELTWIRIPRSDPETLKKATEYYRKKYPRDEKEQSRKLSLYYNPEKQKEMNGNSRMQLNSYVSEFINHCYHDRKNRSEQ